MILVGFMLVGPVVFAIVCTGVGWANCFPRACPFYPFC